MALDINAIRGRLNKLQNTQRKTDALWKPTPGKHQVRIVPYKFNPDNPFIELYFHYNINNKTYLSPQSFGRPDPIVEFADKLKRMGLAESDADRHERLKKRKFFSSLENQDRGINKRYIVTERTTEEFEKERWKKLSLFSKFETIKEAEELNSVIDNIEDYNDFYVDKKMVVSESVQPIQESTEKTIEVEKPGSVFGITQKFYEKDFLNEGKKFILDLNSMVFVPNPNAGK